MDGENRHILTGSDVKDEDRKGADGRRRLHVGHALSQSGFKFEIKREAVLDNLEKRVRREHFNYDGDDNVCHTETTTAPVHHDTPVPETVSADVLDHHFDYLRCYDRHRRLESKQIPLSMAKTKTQDQKTTASTTLELRFCYSSKLVKLVRTHAAKARRCEVGAVVLWEWDMRHAWKAHIGTSDDDGNAEIAIVFCGRGKFKTRRFDLGRNKYSVQSELSFLPSLQKEAVLRVVCNEDAIRAALNDVGCISGEFKIEDQDLIVSRAEASSSGYDQQLLRQARATVNDFMSECDNQTLLIRALRMPRGEDRDTAIERITDRCEHILSVIRRPGYTHKQRCCCCGCETEIDIPTGIRVRSTDRTPHYVCTNLIPFINELTHKMSNKYTFFSLCKQYLLRTHTEVNSDTH